MTPTVASNSSLLPTGARPSSPASTNAGPLVKPDPASTSSSLVSIAAANPVTKTKLSDFDLFLQSLEEEYGHLEAMDTATTPTVISETSTAPLVSQTASGFTDNVYQAAKQFVTQKLHQLRLKTMDKASAPPSD